MVDGRSESRLESPRLTPVFRIAGQRLLVVAPMLSTWATETSTSRSGPPCRGIPRRVRLVLPSPERRTKFSRAVRC